MRLWLPEKASARLSIKGFVGAGCIFPRHRTLMSHKRAESYQGDLTYNRAGVLHSGIVFGR